MAATSKKKAKAKKKTSKKKVAKKTKKAAKKSKASKKKATKKKTKKQAVKAKTTKRAVTKKKTARKTAVKKKRPVKKKISKKATKKKKSATKRESRRGLRMMGDTIIPGVEPYQSKRDEEYMNAPQLDHFRTILENWRAQLVDDINRTIHSMQDETINHPDPNDRATQETDMSLELRSRDRERKLIRKIDETFLLIESGDYGFCENCGVEIGIQRLEARPTATLCIDCKTLDEIREKQMI